MDWGMISAGIGAVTFAAAFAGFWMKFGTRLGQAEAMIAAAQAHAEAANEKAKEAAEKVALLSASFALHREQIAREYIHREVMREVEDRLTAAIERLGDRLDRVLEQRHIGSHV